MSLISQGTDEKDNLYCLGCSSFIDGNDLSECLGKLFKSAFFDPADIGTGNFQEFGNLPLRHNGIVSQPITQSDDLPFTLGKNGRNIAQGTVT